MLSEYYKASSLRKIVKALYDVLEKDRPERQMNRDSCRTTSELATEYLGLFASYAGIQSGSISGIWGRDNLRQVYLSLQDQEMTQPQYAKGWRQRLKKR